MLIGTWPHAMVKKVLAELLKGELPPMPEPTKTNPANLDALRSDPETLEIVKHAARSAGPGGAETTGIRVNTEVCVPIFRKHRRRKPGRDGQPGRFESYGETATRLLQYLDSKVLPVISLDGEMVEAASTSNWAKPSK